MSEPQFPYVVVVRNKRSSKVPSTELVLSKWSLWFLLFHYPFHCPRPPAAQRLLPWTAEPGMTGTLTVSSLDAPQAH